MAYCTNYRNFQSQEEEKIAPSFYADEDVVSIARSLLGKGLYTQIEGDAITGGIIIETESYAGAADRASHAYNNRRTKRTEVMFQKGGIAYVYLCYGIHCLLNAVTGPEGTPHAVLIRAIHPTTGLETMLKRRNTLKIQGPGALAASLGITREHNGISLNSSVLWIADHGITIDPAQIIAGPRVGVDYAGEDARLPYRFRIRA